MDTIDNIETFWGVILNIPKPRMLGSGSNYYIFKAGIKPAWEDPVNTGGGKWFAYFPKNKIAEMEQCWLFTALSLIGETYEHSEEIAGAALSIRRSQNRLAIWTKTALDETACMSIGYHFKEACLMTDEAVISYYEHVYDTSKPRYTL